MHAAKGDADDKQSTEGPVGVAELAWRTIQSLLRFWHVALAVGRVTQSLGGSVRPPLAHPMKPTLSDASSQGRQIRSRVGNLERCLSLLLILIFIISLLPAPSLPVWLSRPLILGSLTLGFLFGLSGIRFGRGGGRIAAGVASTVFFMIMIHNVVIVWSGGVYLGK